MLIVLSELLICRAGFSNIVIVRAGPVIAASTLIQNARVADNEALVSAFQLISNIAESLGLQIVLLLVHPDHHQLSILQRLRG